jgi:hypothetical protein
MLPAGSEGVPEKSPESPFDKGGLSGLGIKGGERDCETTTRRTEVQEETSCRWFGGVPQFPNLPQEWGPGG